MSLETAVRIAEMIMAFALLQQSLEFMRGLQSEKILGLIRAILCVALLFGFQPVWVEGGLLVITIILLRRFEGPYCGGSDAMSMLVLTCLFLFHIAPTPYWQKIALGYLSFQLTYSYFQSGYIKIINPDWRTGKALCEVFAITFYPVSEHARTWANYPRLMFAMSWAVMIFELLFPLALFNQTALLVALFIAALFHLANACLFGLNRFFWIWPAAYPIIFWFQKVVLLGGS